MDISFEIGTGKINLRVTVLCNTPQGILVEKYKNDFYFPIGGRIKLHEDSFNAAQRELDEEIGIYVPDLEYIGIIENFFFHQELHYHEINFVYQAHLSEIPDLPAEIEIIDHDQLSNIDLRPTKIKDIVNGNITLPFHLTIRD